MAISKELKNIKTITIDELAAMFETAESIDTREEISGFVVHEVVTDKGHCLVLPSPSDQLFFVIPV